MPTPPADSRPAPPKDLGSAWRVAKAVATFCGVWMAFALVYRLTAQGRVYGVDGAFLCQWSTIDGSALESYHNVLFHRWARAWDLWLDTFYVPADPLGWTKWFCALAAGLGVAFVFGALRALRFRLSSALAAAVLLGVTPAYWFFATVVEVHALHFALVAGCAWVICVVSWRRVWVATLVVMLALPWTYMSHQSAPALGLGWVMLAQAARVRQGFGRLSWPGFFMVGAAMLLALLLGKASGQWMRGLGFGLGFGEMSETVAVWQKTEPFTVLAYEIVLPLALLLVLALLGWSRRWWARGAVDDSREGSTRWDDDAAALALFVPSAGFLIYWGIVENGGYMVGPGVGLALAAALGFESFSSRGRGSQRAVAAGGFLWLLLPAGVQVVLGLGSVLRHDDPQLQFAQRAQLIEELLPVRGAGDGAGVGPKQGGARGQVLGATFLAPPIQVHVPGLHEVDLLPTFTGVSTAVEWIAIYPDALLGIVGQSPFVLDRSYRVLDEHWKGVFRESLEELERRIQERFDVSEHVLGGWSVWLVRPRV